MSFFRCLKITRQTWSTFGQIPYPVGVSSVIPFIHHGLINASRLLVTRVPRRYLQQCTSRLPGKPILTSQSGLTFRTGGAHDWIMIRLKSGPTSSRFQQRTILIYICAIAITMVGVTYAGVPLYRIFCKATGLGGQATREHKVADIDGTSKVQDRTITIQFNADTASSMQWSFRPQQTEIKVVPGETALAFYTAKNPTDRPIVGISTYNVIPFETGPYFNKIQCFCFEEQRLNPHEQVDMPVFFYIDPEFAVDPRCDGIDRIILSYTFFEAKEGFQVPVPAYLRQWRSAL